MYSLCAHRLLSTRFFGISITIKIIYNVLVKIITKLSETANDKQKFTMVKGKNVKAFKVMFM